MTTQKKTIEGRSLYKEDNVKIRANKGKEKKRT